MSNRPLESSVQSYWSNQESKSSYTSRAARMEQTFHGSQQQSQRLTQIMTGQNQMSYSPLKSKIEALLKIKSIEMQRVRTFNTQ